jgi:hypothetical protein
LIYSRSNLGGSLNPSLSLGIPSSSQSSSQQQSQQRKLVIKPFKVQPKLPDNFEIDTWNKLKSAISNVYNKNASALSKEELYRVISLVSLDFFLFYLLFLRL